jgi:hypothetical protein
LKSSRQSFFRSGKRSQVSPAMTSPSRAIAAATWGAVGRRQPAKALPLRLSRPPPCWGASAPLCTASASTLSEAQVATGLPARPSPASRQIGSRGPASISSASPLAMRPATALFATRPLSWSGNGSHRSRCCLRQRAGTIPAPLRPRADPRLRATHLACNENPSAFHHRVGQPRHPLGGVESMHLHAEPRQRSPPRSRRARSRPFAPAGPAARRAFPSSAPARRLLALASAQRGWTPAPAAMLV